MTKFRLNQSLLFILITAFLSMQSASAHIHLPEHQGHNDSHHQHDLEVHSHQSIDHDTDVVGSSHHTNDINIIELDHKFSAQNAEKPKKSTTTTIPLAFQQPTFISALKTNLPDLLSSKFSYLYGLTANPRGPPKYF